MDKALAARLSPEGSEVAAKTLTPANGGGLRLPNPGTKVCNGEMQLRTKAQR
jgi:hypothetical protein